MTLHCYIYMFYIEYLQLEQAMCMLWWGFCVSTIWIVEMRCIDHISTFGAVEIWRICDKGLKVALAHALRRCSHKGGIPIASRAFCYLLQPK